LKLNQIISPIKKKIVELDKYIEKNQIGERSESSSKGGVDKEDESSSSDSKTEST
jgi:hypothetical protein